MRLLLAEDERYLSSALCEILAKQKYDVDPVYEGESPLHTSAVVFTTWLSLTS